MAEIWLLYSTFETREEAISVARDLLERRLIACANIHGGVTSLYRWQGAVQEAAEVVMVAKTRKEKLDAVIARIKDLHSYQVPCIVASLVPEGYSPFLQWVADETES